MNSIGYESIIKSLSSALAFLKQRQLSSGEFICMVADDETLTLNLREDSSPFITQHILYSLQTANLPICDHIIRKSREFLASEAWPGGVWRYWSKRHPGSLFIPPTTDDTSCNAFLMSNRGENTDLIRKIILGNRNADKIYYNWILPRVYHLRYPQTWPALMHIVRSPSKLRLFFRSGYNKPHPAHVDVVVNANVVLFLGENSATAPAVKWIKQVVESGTEATSDRCYQSKYVLYYALLRCDRAGIRAFDSLKGLIANRLTEDLKNPDKLSIMEKAISLLILTEWAFDVPEIGKTVRYLLNSQRLDGSWPISVFCYGGYNKKTCRFWGSEELVTAFCLEALARYQPFQAHNQQEP
ncbi:MAG: hypothetical protein ACK5FV_07970 [Bacteroidota bacterium]